MTKQNKKVCDEMKRFKQSYIINATALFCVLIYEFSYGSLVSRLLLCDAHVNERPVERTNTRILNRTQQQQPPYTTYSPAGNRF